MHLHTVGLFTALATLPLMAQDQVPELKNYYRDVKPILDTNCVSCHQPGAIAPFSLTTYKEAARFHRAMAKAVRDRVMPPWSAAPGCTEYKYDRSLSTEAIETLQEWSLAGAPEGTPSQFTPAPAADLEKGLTRVDHKLTMQERYTPQADSDGDYRCFLMEWPGSSTQFITGFQARPDQFKEVHHMTAYLATPEMAADYRALDAKDPGPGYQCFGGSGGKAMRLESWAPGRAGGDFPLGTGIQVRPGSLVALQVHYATHGIGKPTPDQSAIEVKVDDSVEKEAVALYFDNKKWIAQPTTMLIPAGNPAVTHSYISDFSEYVRERSGNIFTATEPLKIHYVGFHMHKLGVRGKLWIERQSSEQECALEIPRWDFDWQFYYHFKDAKIIMPGDKFGIECEWDNSQGDHDVVWGDKTTDEMCVGIVYVSKL